MFGLRIDTKLRLNIKNNKQEKISFFQQRADFSPNGLILAF